MEYDKKNKYLKFYTLLFQYLKSICDYYKGKITMGEVIKQGAQNRPGI